MCRCCITSLSGVIRFTFLFAVIQTQAQSNQTIYDDSLENGWANWSWATVNLTNAGPVHTGSKSISVTAGAWQALYFSHNAFDPSTFTNVSFWVNGQAGQTYMLQVSTDLVHWSAVRTNLMASNAFEFFMPMTNAAQMFYRGVLSNP